MLDALLNALNAFTDIPFVELAWSHSPDDKYGVINLDNQLALDADADPVSEKMLTGFVDVFVKKPKDLSTVSDVESALKMAEDILQNPQATITVIPDGVAVIVK